MDEDYEDEYIDIVNDSSDYELSSEDEKMSSASDSEDLPKGWSIETKKRKTGKRAHGKQDRFYVSPEGKKYRSRKQMLQVDEQLKAKNSPKKKQDEKPSSSTNRKRKSTEKTKEPDPDEEDQNDDDNVEKEEEQEEEEQVKSPKKESPKTKKGSKKTPEKKAKTSPKSSKKQKTKEKSDDEEEVIEDISEDEIEPSNWDPSQLGSQVEEKCIQLKTYLSSKITNTKSDKKTLNGVSDILDKINSEASQRKSNCEESNKEYITRLLAVLESITQGLIHFYPFEYDDGQEILQKLYDTWRETLMVADTCAISESLLRKHIQFIVEHDRTFLFRHFPMIEKSPSKKGKSHISTLNAKMFTQVKGLLKDCIGPTFLTSVHAYQFAENDQKRKRALLLAMKHFERNPLPNSKVSKHKDFESMKEWLDLVVKENLVEELKVMLKSVAHRSSFYVRKLYWLFTPLDPSFTFVHAERELKRVAPHIVHEVSKRYFNIYNSAKDDAKIWAISKKTEYLNLLNSTFSSSSNNTTIAIDYHFSKQKDVEFGGEDFVPSSECYCPSYHRGVLGWFKLAQYAIEKRPADVKFEFENRDFSTLDTLILWWKENLAHHLKESDDELIPVIAPNIATNFDNEWTKLSKLFEAYNRDDTFVKYITESVKAFY